MVNAVKTLEFDQILQSVATHANTAQAKEIIMEMKPILAETELKKALRDTSQARELLDAEGSPPIPVMERIGEYVEKTVRNELLVPEQLEQLGMFLAAVERLAAYLKRGARRQIGIAFYGENLHILETLREELERSIRNSQVDDYATNTLRDIRKNLIFTEEKMKSKAESILRAQKAYMAEDFLVTRNGRICLPVKKDYRYRIPGTVVDKSASGATVFLEPEGIAKLREEYELLKIAEENEVQKILYTLCSLVAEEAVALREDIEVVVKLDVMFAKGKYSAEQNAVAPKINTDRRILIRQGRHPLLDSKTCVPLDFALEEPKRGIIITGPNTGGKTVSIKTVGLFSMMAASGLHLPCAEADICMNNAVFCDIGDGQNISDNLSTFSAHIKNIIDIVQNISPESLVILDELGSGTDPTEGMGIAIAILEELRKSGCLFLVTTHYPEVKQYADKHPEVLNARMAFDREALSPLYRLEIGAAGESCALYIAKRLGMPKRMLVVAAREAYKEGSERLLHELLPMQGDNRSRQGMVRQANEEVKSDEGMDEEKPLAKRYLPKIEKEKITVKQQFRQQRFTRGDSVLVLPQATIGIVVKPEDSQGNVLVQMKREKKMINEKRLKLKVKAAELYPEDYDFSIIFDSVENRKAKHEMDRKFTDKTVVVDEMNTNRKNRWKKH